MKQPDGKGSFRGVPFLVFKEQHERGGRNVVKREYPLRESGGADDVGPQLPEFTFTVLVMGNDCQKQRQTLRDALRQPGAGELVHPDYGTLNVLIAQFESRYDVAEQRAVEFTLTVVPQADDTAPAEKKDTAGLLARAGNGALGGVFDTLSQKWAVVRDALHDAEAMMQAVSDQIDAIEDAIDDLGIMQDISVFAGTLAELKGNIGSLITQPGRMAQQMAGLFAGMVALPQTPSLSLLKKNAPSPTPSSQLNSVEAQQNQAIAAQSAGLVYATMEDLRDTLQQQNAQRDMTGLTATTQSNIRLLQDTVATAVVVTRTQMASQLLTAAVARVSLAQRAQPSVAGSTALSAANAAAPDALLLNAGVPLMESADDVTSVADDLAAELDSQVFALSTAGYFPASMQVRDLRLALVDDLTTRGVALPGLARVSVRTTEPALVTLYRATGSSLAWQRFVRRNAITDPLFVPGGDTVEVIDDQPG
ncbi:MULTISPECIES: DNA circularization protein [Serratia]|uniref:DNA circularization protein n=1 Tax=Serratia TaxID=613 RepID=UPI00065FAAEB|nr:DNA circularization N-terminal domain-containing protein [Serratia sp. 506_PEND]